MIDLIVKFVFAGSAAGLGFIALKKMPVLAGLPAEKISLSKTEVLAFFKEKTKTLPFLKGLSLDKLIWKILLRARILILKAENKTTTLLEGIKNKSQKKEKEEKLNSEPDKYWEELRKAKRGE